MNDPRIVVAAPPADATREELEAWAAALIDLMRPKALGVDQTEAGG